jgi:hypothetical protein
MISRAEWGSSGMLPPSCIYVLRGFSAALDLEPPISRSRAPVAPVYLEQASRSLVDIRTLRESVLFKSGAARGSSLLGKRQGHLMPAVAAIVTHSGRAFSGAAAAHVVGGVGRRT